MADSISNSVLALVTSSESSKKVSMKESMEWKNIFDKNMFNMFKQSSENEVSSGKNRSIENHQKNASVPEKQVRNADTTKNTKSGNGPHSTNGSQSQLSRTDWNGQNSKANVSSQISPSIGINQILQSFDNAANKLNILSSNSTSNKVLQSYTHNTSNMSLARIHFSATEEGVKVYVRNNYLDKDSIIERVKDLLGNFNHMENAIHDIVYNGKSQAI